MLPIIFVAAVAAFTDILSDTEPAQTGAHKFLEGAGTETGDTHRAQMDYLRVQNPYSPVFGVGTFWRRSHSESWAPQERASEQSLKNPKADLPPLPARNLEKGMEAMVDPKPAMTCEPETPVCR